MNETLFKALILLCAIVFTTVFCWIVIPPLIANPDVIGAFADGFVNPYASGYSTDVIICWLILTIWIVFEAAENNIKHGWICIILGIVPGVAVGFALYLLLRHKQLTTPPATQT